MRTGSEETGEQVLNWGSIWLALSSRDFNLVESLPSIPLVIGRSAQSSEKTGKAVMRLRITQD